MKIEIKIYQSKGKENPIFNRIKGNFYAVCPYTEEKFAEAKTLKKLAKIIVENFGGVESDILKVIKAINKENILKLS